MGRIMLLGNYRLDQWILGAVSGAREVGLYSVAVAWAEALWYLPTALSAVQRPDLVRASEREARRVAGYAFRVSAVLTLVLAAGLVIVAPVLCTTFFGEDFSGAVPQLRILALGALGVVAMKQLGSALTARGRPALASAAIGVSFVCTVVLDIALIPTYDGIGAAVASSLAYTAGGIAVAAAFVVALRGSVRDLVPRPGELARWARRSAVDARKARNRRRRPRGARVTTAAYVSRRFANLPPTEWAAVGAIAAIGVGALAGVDRTLALAAMVVLALLLVVSRHTAAILSILGATVSVEMVRIGELRITRVIAPIALLILVAYLIKRGGKLRADPPLLWALAYATWALASGLWSRTWAGRSSSWDS